LRLTSNTIGSKILAANVTFSCSDHETDKVFREIK